MKTLVTFLLTCILSLGSALAEEPAFPGQPNINIALKKLTEAQEILNLGTGKPAEAAAKLQEAQGALEKASKNKGSYRQSAIRLVGQAVKHLDKGDVDTAKHEITEALENVNKAGQTGGR